MMTILLYSSYNNNNRMSSFLSFLLLFFTTCCCWSSCYFIDVTDAWVLQHQPHHYSYGMSLSKQQQQQHPTKTFIQLRLTTTTTTTTSMTTNDGNNNNNDDNISSSTSRSGTSGTVSYNDEYVEQQQNIQQQQIEMENVVKRYFQGVHEKNPIMIRTCFDKVASIRDVCNINHHHPISPSPAPMITVPAEQLVQRCMDFVTAHPDCSIQFYYGPICGRRIIKMDDDDKEDGNTNPNHWVFVHWYETGTWSHESCSIVPPLPTKINHYNKMYVEGQTRFYVNPFTMKIEQLIVTRTYTEWEKQFILLKQQQQNVK